MDMVMRVPDEMAKLEGGGRAGPGIPLPNWEAGAEKLGGPRRRWAAL